MSDAALEDLIAQRGLKPAVLTEPVAPPPAPGANELPTLPHLFQDGVHLVTYKTLDEAVEKAKYYIEHDDERDRIAEAGYKEFIKKHTYEHRLKTVLEIVQKPELVKV